jgi:hypothetical protein
MAKSRQKIDASQVEELAVIGSTPSEMAILLNCSEANLVRRFSKTIKRGVVRRKIFLKLALFTRAMNGDATALKWFLAQPNEQLQDLERHEEEVASLSEDELIKRAIEVRDEVDRTLKICANKSVVPAEPWIDADTGSAPTKLPN